MKRKIILLAACPLLFLSGCAKTTSFVVTPYDNFDVDKNKYDLEKVLILSRHNIRSPLTGGDSDLSQVTNHEWFKWTSKPSELSLKGGILETINGQYFRKYLLDRNFMQDSYGPNDPELDKFYFYANTKQRTLATAQYFSSGLLPSSNIKINYNTSIDYDTMDPIFNPALNFTSDKYQDEVMKEIKTKFSNDWTGLDKSYKLLEKVLDYSQSKKAKTLPHFLTNDIKIKKLEVGQEPAFEKEVSLRISNSAVDALKLQYYEQPDESKAFFGHNLPYVDLQKICEIADVYQNTLFTLPLLSVNLSHQLVNKMNDELSSDAHKFTFLCGHDSNIASVLSALNVDTYSLVNTISKQTPIGAKLVIEKWQDKTTDKDFYSLSMVYQRVDQLRNNTPLSLQNPPVKFELSLNGLKKNNDGLYSEAEFLNRFQQTLNRYDEIEKEYDK